MRSGYDIESKAVAQKVSQIGDACGSSDGDVSSVRDQSASVAHVERESS